jgi:hypothetical protein
MFSSFSLAVLLAASIYLVRADVNPSTPNTANAGSTCVVQWSADTNSTSNWANMTIELMTGSNFDMVFMTTVSTDLDGTKDGQFSWTCPQVDPYSAIYFYQFVSPSEVTNPQWTTRFTIASSSGATTTPTNAKQPNGDAIPWGTGALVDAVAVAPPSFAADVPSGVVTASTVAAASSSSSSAASSASVAVSKTTGAASKTAGAASNTASAAGNTGGAAGGTGAVLTTAGATPSSSSASNGELGLAVDGKVWMSALAVMGSAMGLALFL